MLHGLGNFFRKRAAGGMCGREVWEEGVGGRWSFLFMVMKQFTISFE